MSQNETDNAIGRRMKAARSLKQVTVDELADLIGIQGLGAKTIGNIERGDRPLRNHEAVLIAQALDVPVAFLLGANPAGQHQLDVIEQLLREDAEERRQQREEIIERLEALEAHLTARTDALLPGVRSLLRESRRVPGVERRRTVENGK
jgi:transcriptional regulator with XRE-family HTH domain